MSTAVSEAVAPAAELSADQLVITGWTALSPYGLDRAAFTAGLGSAASTAVDASQVTGTLPSPHACLVPGFDIKELLGKKGTGKLDRLSALVMVASDQLLRDADGEVALETDELTGVVVGSSMGSLETITEGMRQSLTNARPFYVDAGKIPVGTLNHAAGACAIRHGLKGPNTTLGGGRVSGLLALNYARRLLGQGRASSYLCGSAEEFSAAHAWLEHVAVERGEESPLLGEGCGMFLLELAGRAQRPALASVLAVESRVDIDDDPAAAVTACVRQALDRAGVRAEEVWAACPSAAPGRSGRAESAALDALLPAEALDRVPTMAHIGDTSAAAASLQLAAVLAVAERDPASAGRIALVTAVDRDGGVGCAVLRLLAPAANGGAA
ncbi:3-oxoacyl-ACP synthase [Streptomyces triticagri]|uniref:3-oxoacyl-ACP synthase n=1 Tax=Streptomyces triticagri TaxID=2293568 RepID=A0A372MCJ5_9ACTN|nr:beta-ketoacyl synthase N-terminal-like domain-containing protein [Streptomyces triticagri]RFU88310.1 3-oxoacyl-ACP synthase [Streptomyces triticagri]